MSHLILTCEHASDRIPARYQSAFASSEAEAALASHRGVDYGAAAVARSLARRMGAPCVYGRFSRLLIDLNRTEANPRRFSEFTRALAPQWRAELDTIHQEHWRAVRSLIDDAEGLVTHVAVHTFSPVMKGKIREMDVGILYDPRRARELRWARLVQKQIEEETGLRVRRNAPYRGTADGLPTGLRRSLSPRQYLGIELEINQALVWPKANDNLVRVLASAMGDVGLMSGSTRK